MNVILSFTVTVTFALVVSASSFAVGRQTFSRPTLIGAACEGEPVWHVRVYEDEEYLFVYRHYGKAEYVPGFFVRSKRRGRWVEVKKLSTEHAKLGHSPPLDEVLLSVAWDHGHLKSKDYAELPLRTSGSISFPDEIIYEADRESYRLIFNPRLKTKYQTWFQVLRKDLEAAFDGP